jgi:hypothetical protein
VRRRSDSGGGFNAILSGPFDQTVADGRTKNNAPAAKIVAMTPLSGMVSKV